MRNYLICFGLIVLLISVLRALGVSGDLCAYVLGFCLGSLVTWSLK